METEPDAWWRPNPHFRAYEAAQAGAPLSMRAATFLDNAARYITAMGAERFAPPDFAPLIDLLRQVRCDRALTPPQAEAFNGLAACLGRVMDDPAFLAFVRRQAQQMERR